MRPSWYGDLVDGMVGQVAENLPQRNGGFLLMQLEGGQKRRDDRRAQGVVMRTTEASATFARGDGAGIALEVETREEQNHDSSAVARSGRAARAGAGHGRGQWD